jgi:hypothetical protein
VRGISRLELIRTALAPLKGRLTDEEFDRLANAVVLVFGVEAMVAARDVSGLDAKAGPAVMAWAARALVQAAVAEAGLS